MWLENPVFLCCYTREVLLEKILLLIFYYSSKVSIGVVLSRLLSIINVIINYTL